MEPVKKSFNLDKKLIEKADEIIQANQGVNMTTIVNQALAMWLENPSIKLARPRDVSIEEIEKLMDEDGDLLLVLAK